MISSFFAALALHATLSNAVPLLTRQSNSTRCKVIPGDEGWPSVQTWAQLNQTVEGRLIATVPLGSVCHGSSFDQSQCSKMQSEWGFASLVVPQPAEFMSTWFQNNTCTPFSDPSGPCELGNRASYSIDVRSVEDIQAGLAFAKSRNVRLVVKNSGHDFFGKSTGKGALSLWVNNLKSTTFIPGYKASYYAGPAVRIGAGVEGGDAATFASEHGYRVVVGACPTVKAAGGFTQGGGHSFLTGKYGFGADNVLEWEAVTADGEHVVATPTNEHADLYWALSGGGGGTYAVVVSMTVRAFPDGDVALASWSINVANAGGVDAYWEAVSVYHTHMKSLVDQGFVAEYMVSNESLDVFGLMAPDHTADSLGSAMAPLLSSLAAVYHDLYAATIGPLMAGNSFAPAVAGRFLPRAVIEANSTAWHAALRHATSVGDGRYFASVTTLNSRNPHRVAAVAANALQPNFETAFSSLIISPRWSHTQPWSDAAALVRELEDEVMPVLEQVTPGAGAYKNEASWTQKNPQEAFYAGTYPRLADIKARYDPEGLLYGLTTVGSERWVSDSEGRLCAA
ncbi:FAD-binding domain-containing protein [Corynespora cassiicola Philippines]|uniref:FAD-binding domain-containing protein n=1 Tax=Corynespora cassiicola Philippines TaxID=1448308 RepID=A0A2T2N257_CORCC|nr:FAD-binding domain-containing protein [Corynespora cassiicola Philippines]